MRLSLEKAVEVTARVVKDVVEPAAASVDEEGRWPADAMRALQAGGLGGLVVPEDAGGSGQGLLALFEVTRLLGRASASTALCYGMHCVGAAVIAAKATEEQRSTYLEPIASGTHLTTLALSEPGSGSQFWLPATTLEPCPEGFRLNGTKSFVTNGTHADSYVVSTVAAMPSAPIGEFSCVVVDSSLGGMHWGEPWAGIGMRGNDSRTVDMRDVTVPEHALLGARGDQLWYVFNVVAPYFLVAMSGTYLGLAEAALEEARLHVAERRHANGVRLAELAVVQHRIGTLWASLARTRALCAFAAEEADRGGPEALPALCAAKAEVGEAATDAVNESLSLMGGIGYRQGGAMERRLRDVRAAHVMAPTTDLLRLWTGRALLGEHLLAD